MGLFGIGSRKTRRRPRRKKTWLDKAAAESSELVENMKGENLLFRQPLFAMPLASIDQGEIKKPILGFRLLN